MRIAVTNAQRETPVDRAQIARLAAQAVRRLCIRTRGTLGITFLGRRQIRALNRRFLRHDRPTDVLSFRYDNGRTPSTRGSRLEAGSRSAEPPRPDPACRGGRAPSPEPIVGEIFIAPALARMYAQQHGISYKEELSRYVVHGILHWLGHQDKTVRQQRAMRIKEDQLLNR